MPRAGPRRGRHRAGRLRGARAAARPARRRRALEPEQARFRLFDSVTTFLRERRRGASRSCSSSTTCTGPTRRRCCCSQFLARELRGSPAPGRSAPTATSSCGRQPPALADARPSCAREGLIQRVLLRGLTEADVARFIEMTAEHRRRRRARRARSTRRPRATRSSSTRSCACSPPRATSRSPRRLGDVERHDPAGRARGRRPPPRPPLGGLQPGAGDRVGRSAASSPVDGPRAGGRSCSARAACSSCSTRPTGARIVGRLSEGRSRSRSRTRSCARRSTRSSA